MFVGLLNILDVCSSKPLVVVYPYPPLQIRHITQSGCNASLLSLSFGATRSRHVEVVPKDLLCWAVIVLIIQHGVKVRSEGSVAWSEYLWGGPILLIYYDGSGILVAGHVWVEATVTLSSSQGLCSHIPYGRIISWGHSLIVLNSIPTADACLKFTKVPCRRLVGLPFFSRRSGMRWLFWVYRCTKNTRDSL